MALAFAGVSVPVIFRNCPEVIDCLARVLHGWPAQVVPENTSAPYIEITPDGGGYRTDTPWLDEPLAGATAVSTVCSLIVDLIQAFVSHDPGLLCLHCGAVRLDGRLVLLTGPNRAGKSTLVARLAAAEVTVFSDDLLPIASPEAHGRALGVKSRLRLPLPRGAAGGFRRFVVDHAGPSDGRYLYVDAPALAPHGTIAPIGAIIMLERQPGVMAYFEAAGRAEALRHLVERNLARSEAAEQIIDRLHRLMAQSLCLRLVYSDLEEATALILATFGRWPTDGIKLAQAPRPQPPAPNARRATRDAAALLEATYRRDPGVAMRDVDGELFLAAGGGQAILHLNVLGAGLWNLLAEPTSAAEAVEALSIAFPESDPTVIAEDVMTLFADLAEHGLIVTAATGD